MFKKKGIERPIALIAIYHLAASVISLIITLVSANWGVSAFTGYEYINSSFMCYMWCFPLEIIFTIFIVILLIKNGYKKLHSHALLLFNACAYTMSGFWFYIFEINSQTGQFIDFSGLAFRAIIAFTIFISLLALLLYWSMYAIKYLYNKNKLSTVIPL